MEKKGIHIEPTSKCAIECPLCPRTKDVGLYPVRDIDIDLAVKACDGFDLITMCGNHGDPIYHRRFHELLSSIRHANPRADIDIITNGAYRSKVWWETTASLLRNNDSITFSIDGTAGNNHFYRVNSKWNHIETAIKTVRYLQPHMKLGWKFILFRYNENSVDEAITVARDLGINVFEIVKSSRTEILHLNPSKTLLDLWIELDACRSQV